MNEQDNSFKSQFEKEYEEIRSVELLSPEFRRKKFLLWSLRTLVALILYIIFWKHSWVRWTLVIYIPLTLISLFSIYGWNYAIKKKMERVEKKVEAVEQFIKESEENE
ncbi:hypothetical protein ABN763_09080 [Spongiivirga sp. MCCC 1A20706]|uniref:hypothetical protein n=1 Tax=Spongiivirga sp. MCCC 1A20706 TaxID=3160963 RepID=UPI003977AF24